MDKKTLELARSYLPDTEITPDANLSEMQPVWDESPSLTEQLAWAGLQHEAQDGQLRTIHAKRFLANSIVIFSLGDDYLDQAPLTSVQSKAILKTLLDGVLTPGDTYPPIAELLQATDIAETSPYVSDDHFLAQYELLNHTTNSLGRDKQGLVASASLTRAERELVHDTMDDYLTRVFMVGEQATFEIEERLLRGEGAHQYFQDICIAGNAYTFIPRQMAQSLGENLLWMPDKNDSRLAEVVSCYWQAADDAVDFAEDVQENKPKMLFLVNELGQSAQKMLNGGSFEQVCAQSSWYAFLQGGLPDKSVTPAEFFCCQSGALEGTTLKKRVQQMVSAHQAVQGASGILSDAAKATIIKILEDINFLPTIQKAAEEFDAHTKFPVQGFGAYLGAIYKRKMKKVFGNTCKGGA